MSIFASPRFLPRVLWADALVSALTGLLHLAASGSLSQLTGLPTALLTGTGLFYLVYAATVGWMASRDPSPRALVMLVAVGNIAWGLACIGLLAAGTWPTTALGNAWVMVQALAVIVLGELQWLGLRASAPSHRAAA